MKPFSQDGYQLLHDAILVFSKMEHNGICVDIEYCKQAMKHLTRQINRLDAKLLDTELYTLGRRAYGKNFSFTDDQLRTVIFDVMGKTPISMTKSGKPSMSADALEALNLPGINIRVRKNKLMKARDTYISNFLKESVDGKMHPFFNLHTARTFRSSSAAPNFQNIPNRDPEIQKLCRKAIIPSPGNRLAFIDFSGVEVRIGAAYHQDPQMIKYITDPTTDMHRDMAKEIYKIDDKLWDLIAKETPKSAKMIRHSGKNEFVFPEFYGDWYKSCAGNLWLSAHKATHTLPDGRTVAEYMAEDCGIGTLSAFEDHMQEVERGFWYDRFPVYNSWKDKRFKEYEKRGYFDTLTGFRCQGVMNQKDVCNYPVQGSAFHCTLYSAIEIQKLIDKHDLQTKIVGQIHDEVVLDLVESEKDFVLKEVKRVMTIQLREHWQWINVPIDVEVDITPVDGSWYQKAEVIVEL